MIPFEQYLPRCPSYVGDLAERTGLSHTVISDRLFGPPSQDWSTLLKKNQKAVEVGDHVVLLVPPYKWFEGVPKRKSKLKWRTKPYSVGGRLPAPGGVYSIDGTITGDLGDLFFRWAPDDETGWDDRLHDNKRKHLVRWRVWREEVFAINLISFSTLTRFTFHTAALPEDAYVRHILRTAWRFRVLNEDGLWALPRIVAQRLNIDPQEFVPEVWGGLLSWRLANENAPLPAADNLLGVSALLPYVEDWIAENKQEL